MEDALLWVFCAAAGLVGSVGALVAQRTDLLRRIRRVRRRSIAQLQDNMRARVTGIVRELDGLLDGGLTGRGCVFYRAEIFGPASASSDIRATLINEERGTPFVLEDETGRAVVDPAIARVVITADAWSRPETFRGPTPRTDAVLARHGYANRTPAWRAKLWACESVILPGDRVTVVGLCVRETDTAGGAYREGGAIAVRMGGSREQPLWMTKDRDALQ